MSHVLCKPLFPRQLCKLSLYFATPWLSGILANLEPLVQPNYRELGKSEGETKVSSIWWFNEQRWKIKYFQLNSYVYTVRAA
jgi:hypothetical protein